MRLHDLKPAAGSHRDRKRLGRGNASGQGTTAGKGTKGQKARSGGMKAGFRGMSSRNQRMAKRRGFTNRFRVEYKAINVNALDRFEAGATVTIDSLRDVGLIKGKDTLPKILGDGELAVALTLVGLKVSGSARDKVVAAGGSVIDAAGQDVAPTATATLTDAPTAGSSSKVKIVTEAGSAAHEQPAAVDTPSLEQQPDVETESAHSTSSANPGDEESVDGQ